MKPQHFLDIRVIVPPEDGGADAAIRVVTRLVYVLHGIFRTYPGVYAMALPAMKTGNGSHGPYPGDMVRVFAEQFGQVRSLRTLLEGNDRLAKYLAFSVPQEVPPDFTGPWREYRRFRIPGRGTRYPETRERRFKLGDALPYLRLRSGNGQFFSLRVDSISAEQGSEGCEPDGYGLSRLTKSFALPEP